MTYFHIYSFILAALPLLLGFLFIWFGKKLWNNAAKKNEEYQQRYTGPYHIACNQSRKK